MSYKTLQVEIKNGAVVPVDGSKLPENAKGLLTVIPLEQATVLLPPQVTRGPRPIGLAKGEFTVPEDFNTPLPEEVLRSFEGA